MVCEEAAATSLAQGKTSLGPAHGIGSPVIATAARTSAASRSQSSLRILCLTRRAHPATFRPPRRVFFLLTSSVTQATSKVPSDEEGVMVTGCEVICPFCALFGKVSMNCAGVFGD